jgi:hypothetical protein
MTRMQKIGSNGLSTSRNIASSNSRKSFFKPSRRQIVSLGPFHNLKHYLSDFVLVTFFHAQDGVGMSIWHPETSFHRLHQSRCLRRLEDKLEVLRAIRFLKTSLKRICPSRLFRCSGCRKRVRIASLQRLHQRRFLRLLEDRIRVLWAIRLPKTSLMRSSMSLFSMDMMQKMSLHDVWLLEKSVHRLYQSHFLRRSESRL